MSKRKTTRRILLSALALLLVAAIIAVVYFLTRPPRDAWFSPADAARPWLENVWAHVTQPEGVPSEPYSGWFDEMKVEREGNLIRLIHATAVHAPFHPAISLHRLDDSFACQIDAGSFSLDWIASGWPAGEPDLNDSVPMNFFHPTGESVTEEELGSLGIHEEDRSTSFENRLGPAVSFGIRVEGFEDFQAKNLALFDARTHHPVGYPGAPAQPDAAGRMRWETFTHAWHPAPVLAMFDFAHGPSQEEVLPAEVGAHFEHDGIVGRILMIERGTRAGTRIQQRDDGGQIEIDLKEEDREAHHLILMGVHPDVYPMAITLEPVNAAGGGLPSKELIHTNHFILQECAAPLETLAGVRVRLRPYYRRILMEFDELPGLPAYNRGVANLFDVRIPYVRLEHEGRMEELLRWGSQLNSVAGRSWRSVDPGPTYFPKEMRDVTLREVAEEYRQKFFPKSDAWIDFEKGEIHIEESKGFWRTITDEFNKARGEWHRTRQQRPQDPVSRPQ